MKKLTAVILTFIAVAGLFMYRGTNMLEIKKRLIIQAIGFDTADSGKIRMSVQTLNTDVSTNASSNSTPEKIVKNYTVEGLTPADCMEKLKALTGKNPLLSQNRVVIFSSEYAEHGIGKLLDSFLRNNENRFNVFAAVCADSAQELICADCGEGVVPARLIEQALKATGADSSKARIYEIVNCICDGNKSAVLPLLKAVRAGETYTPEIIGSAVFRGDKLSRVTGTDTAAGINYLLDKVDSGKLSFTCNAGAVCLDILKSKTVIRPRIDTNNLTFNIEIVCSAAVTEIDAEIDAKKDMNTVDTIGKAAEDEIKSCVQNAVNECIIENGEDICGLSRYVWRKFPRFYRENEGNTQEMLKNADYVISVSVIILRTGDSVIAL